MVDYITPLVASFLAILLLTSVTEKLINWRKSIDKITAYKIIPKKFNGFVFFAGTLLEIYLATKLIINQFSLLDCILYSILLLTYSVAIAINLYKGHIRISCGCGGVLESDQLSWKHLLRNSLLVIFGVITYLNKKNIEIFTLEFAINILVGANLVILYGVIKEFNFQHNRIQKIKSIIKI